MAPSAHGIFANRCCLGSVSLVAWRMHVCIAELDLHDEAFDETRGHERLLSAVVLDCAA